MLNKFIGVLTHNIRLIIYIVFALVILFTISKVINTARKPITLTDRQQPHNNLPENIQKDLSVDKKIISRAQKGAVIKKSESSKNPLESKNGISIVKSPEFSGVAEPEQSPFDILQELLGGQRNVNVWEDPEGKKTSPIFISREVLHYKKITPVAKSKGPTLKKVISGVEKGSDKQPVLIKAPVDYKIFKDRQTWYTFTSSQVGKPDKSCNTIDFTKEDILILVSMSEFPNRIFKLVKVIDAGNETIIYYRIDPLVMSVRHPNKNIYYPCAVIKKNSPSIRLEQVP